MNPVLRLFSTFFCYFFFIARSASASDSWLKYVCLNHWVIFCTQLPTLLLSHGKEWCCLPLGIYLSVQDIGRLASFPLHFINEFISFPSHC